MRLTADETRRWLEQVGVTMHDTGKPCTLPVTGGSLIVDVPMLRAAWKITLARVNRIDWYDVETLK